MKLYAYLFLGILLLFSFCRGERFKDVSKAPISIKEGIVKGDTVDQLGNNIMVIYQDKKDNYWFGSWETGVYRYDGNTLIQFTTTHGLPNNRIDEIKEDQFGNIYFSSCHPHSRITKYDGIAFTSLSPIPSKDWELKNTDIWFRHAYRQEKVFRYDGKVLHELSLEKPPDLSNSFEIYSIYKDNTGNIWFGTNPVGVCRYNGRSFDWITEEDVTEFRDEGANGVRSITEDVNGDFWFNTEYRYHVQDSIIDGGSFYKRNKSIGGLDGKKESNLDEYLSSVRDDQNNLWFVTYRDGVWKFDGSHIEQFEVQVDSMNITLFSIYKDNHGDLWLGSHENGTFKFDGSKFEPFKAEL